jgi:hypothetical protein
MTRDRKPRPTPPPVLRRYIRRRIAKKTLRETPKSPADMVGRADEALGAKAKTPSDVTSFGGRRHAKRRFRTQAFSTFVGRTGVSYDPLAALSYKFSRMLRSPGRSPIKQICPQTGAILWYFDAETRRRWQDAACTIPYGPANPDPR